MGRGSGGGGLQKGGIPQISGNPAPCPSFSPEKGGPSHPRPPLETPPLPKAMSIQPFPLKPSTKRGSQAMVGVQGAEMDFLGNKRTLELRPSTPKLKRFREHPRPPQGEGSRRDPGSLISTLVLPPATSLCPHHAPAPGLARHIAGAALGGISGTWVGPRRCLRTPFPRLLPPHSGFHSFHQHPSPKGYRGGQGVSSPSPPPPRLPQNCEQKAIEASPPPLPFPQDWPSL